MLNVGLEVQQQIRGGDGTLLWCGGGYIASSAIFEVKTGNTGPLLGEAVQWDATNSVIPRPETTAAGASPTADLPMSTVFYGNVSPAVANSVNVIGVAQQPIAATKRGLVALDGSIVCVKSTATLLAIGNAVASSATAGSVAVAGVTLLLNNVIGWVLKINQVAAPGTGSTTFAGIIIKGGATAAS